MKNYIATKTSEITFVKGTDSEFTSDFAATIEVKVDQLVKTISYQVTKGKPTRNSENFADLKAVGIKIDFSSIDDEYKRILAEKTSVMTELKTIKANEAYDACWIHNFIPTPQDNLTVTRPTREEYVEAYLSGTGRNNPTIKLTYKGYDIVIDYRNVANYRRHTEDWRYQMDGQLTGYKCRNYKKADTLVSKFIELVEEKIESEKARKQEVARKADKITATLDHLKATFSSLEIVHKQEYESYGRRMGGGMKDYYWLKKEGRQVSIKVHNLDAGEDHVMYSLSGLHDLDKMQVTTIMKTI